MMPIKRVFKALVPYLVFSALAPSLGCAPETASSSLTTPPSGNVRFPTGESGQQTATDMSAAPAAVLSFLGTYEGEIVRNEFGTETKFPFRMTLKQQQNTTGSGPKSFATVKFELPTVEGFTALDAYMGYDPIPYKPWGPTGAAIYILMSSSMNSSHLSYSPVAIMMKMAVDPVTSKFDPSRSRIDFYDCGFSSGTVCSNLAVDVRFGSVSRKL